MHAARPAAIAEVHGIESTAARHTNRQSDDDPGELERSSTTRNQQILIKVRRRERSQETVTASTAPQDEFILPSRNASRWREQNASCNDRRHGTESTAPHEGLSRLVELDRRDKHPWRRSSSALETRPNCTWQKDRGPTDPQKRHGHAYHHHHVRSG